MKIKEIFAFFKNIKWKELFESAREVLSNLKTSATTGKSVKQRAGTAWRIIKWTFLSLLAMILFWKVLTWMLKIAFFKATFTAVLWLLAFVFWVTAIIVGPFIALLLFQKSKKWQDFLKYLALIELPILFLPPLLVQGIHQLTSIEIPSSFWTYGGIAVGVIVTLVLLLRSGIRTSFDLSESKIWKFVIYGGLAAGLVLGLLALFGFNIPRDVWKDVNGITAIIWLIALAFPTLAIISTENKWVRRLSIAFIAIVFLIMMKVPHGDSVHTAEQTRASTPPTPNRWLIGIQRKAPNGRPVPAGGLLYYTSHVVRMDDSVWEFKMYFQNGDGSPGMTHFVWFRTNAVGNWDQANPPESGTWVLRDAGLGRYEGQITNSQLSSFKMSLEQRR